MTVKLTTIAEDDTLYKSRGDINANFEAVVAELASLKQNLEATSASLVETKSSLEAEQTKLANYWNDIYPVGSVYMSFNATSPATLFGGTWEALDEGRVLIGANSSYAVDSTGGEVSHTLIVEETPSHTHTRGSMNITGETRWISGNALWQGDPNGAFEKYYTDNVSMNQVAISGTGARYAFKFDASRNWTGETSSVGGSQAHNNMQPYRAVYMWRRTA